jgi:hypothetical protein
MPLADHLLARTHTTEYAERDAATYKTDITAEEEVRAGQLHSLND